jgi:phenol/toluene 2-monooxygenase (NADH) P1/A1
VQYELRTKVIEPHRKTFTNLAARFGDRPASRYEEGSVDIQPVANFHYRPLWDPEHEIYDPSYSQLQLTDPYSFTDPRQFYYAPYVTARSQLHENFGATLSYLENRDLLDRLPEAWKTLTGQVVLPLRHYESGGQLISAFGCRFAYGTTVEQCLSYASFDRVGNAQLLSRWGMSLAQGGDELLVTAKAAWTDAEHLQPLRRYVEELLVEPDWAISHLSLDVADQLLYNVLYRHLDEAALLGGAGGYSLLAQHLSGWFTDQRRWADALYTAWAVDPEHGADNVAALTAALDAALPRALDAVGALAAHADSLLGTGCAAAVTTIGEQVRSWFTILAAKAPVTPKEAGQ